MIVRAAPPEHYGWIAQRAQLVPGPSFRAIEAVDEQGRIHGMVGYDGWTENMVCVHIALDHPGALRHLIKPGFGIPFLELGRGVLVAQVLSTNERSLRLMTRLGFTYLSRVRDGWAKGVDVCLFEMRREDCRFIEKEERWAA
jgi:hypothetical protein